MKKRANRTTRSSRGPVKYHVGKFPPNAMDWERLIPLIGPASAALARYDGLLSAIPNAAVLLSPLTTQEAVLSSRIEGTQATMGEVLEYEAGGGRETADPEKVEDIREIINYRQAMRHCEQRMSELPLCGRLIREAHGTLLSGVRGENKARGKYRTIQNYIGAYGRPIEEARFVPIAPDEVKDGMSRWEKFLHSNQPDVLVQLAIAHAEFEAVHPFLDGNGRIGRMLIPLFLFERELLHAPMFYLSEYLESHRQEYYDRLLAVSGDDDWTGWCEFFLEAITEQAVQNQSKAQSILTLYETKKRWIIDSTHSVHAINALDFIFNRPIFRTRQFVSESSIPRATAYRIIEQMVGGDLVHELKSSRGSRSAVLAFAELLEITEGRAVI